MSAPFSETPQREWKTWLEGHLLQQPITISSNFHFQRAEKDPERDNVVDDGEGFHGKNELHLIEGGGR